MRNLLLIIIASGFLSSCSKKNGVNPSTSLIVGKWNFVVDSAKLYTYPNNVFVENIQTPIVTQGYVQFNNDGNATSSFSSGSINSFSYKVADGKLIEFNPMHTVNGMPVPASSDTLTIVTLTSNNLVLYRESIDPPAGGIRYKSTYSVYYTK